MSQARCTMSGESASRRVILLGSTGSIGTNTIAVIEHLQRTCSMSFNIVGLAAGTRADVLLEQACRLGVQHVAISDADRRSVLDADASLTVFAGADAAHQLVDAVAQPGDMVVAAMVGSAGLPAVCAAIERGCDIALANKETLVAAGELVMPAVQRAAVRLLPVDSEHSAVFQCLLAGRSIDEVRRLVITASGGPFRTWSPQRTHEASVEEALNHPTWDMGAKITIDSATLLNKALEVIEAHWLFDMPRQRIDVIVHPQSIVHSFVEFVDGSTMAQLGPPDMRTPIQYALTSPSRVDGCAASMDWQELSRLTFEPVDHDRFPAIRLAWRCIDSGGTSGAILNAANEVAVAAFLDRRISFGRISELVDAALERIESRPVQSLDDVHHADRLAREFVARALSTDRRSSTAASTAST